MRDALNAIAGLLEVLPDYSDETLKNIIDGTEMANLTPFAAAQIVFARSVLKREGVQVKRRSNEPGEDGRK